MEKKSNSKIKTIVIVILTNILVIGAAIGISFGVKTVVDSKNAPEYTVKVNEKTGAEEYYDKNGKFAYQVNKEYADMENKVVSREVYADEENNTTKIVYFKENTTIVERVDEYEDGKVSVQHTYKDGTDTGERWEFKYDDKGNKTKSVNYAADNSVIVIKEESHNKDGKPVLYTETDADGNVVSKTEYSYNKDGSLKKAVFYDSEGTTGYVEYKYGEDGRVERMDEYKDGKLLDYRLFKYDKDGNCTEEFHEANEK